MQISNEFPLASELCYLNHAAVAPWPLRTVEAIKRFAEENLVQGATNYPEWEVLELALREQLRLLINAPSVDDIALVKNTSEGLSMIAYGLDWQNGDEVIISNQEFPSNRIVWESLNQFGVRVVEVDIDCQHPEQEVIKHFTANTKLVSLSSIQYASGLRMDLREIGKACKKSKVLFCVDAIQSLGAFQFDLQDCHADFVVADGHKWMLGPEGVALFYSQKDVRQPMKVFEYGWRMVDTAGDYETKKWAIDSSARRFECGSPNMLGIHGLHGSLSLIHEVGLKEIESKLMRIVNYLISSLQEIDACTVQSPLGEDRKSGIVNFKIAGIDSTELKQRLMDRQVICAYRGGGIRFSPHFYTPVETIDLAIKILKEEIADLS